MESKFATCLNCIDGRVQLPVINWITKNFEFDYVDMITEAGIDGLLAENSYNPANVLRKLAISLGQHDSSKIFIVGHYDCTANPVDENMHKIQIKKSVKRIKNYTLACEVIGLWVNKHFEIEIIYETGGLNKDDTPVYEYSTS
jgi:carbonic anhydrase